MHVCSSFGSLLRLLLIFTVVLHPAIALSAAGRFVWAQRIGGVSGDTVEDIAVDERCNVYSVGFFTNRVDFDPGPGVTYVSAVDSDIYILKLDCSHAFQWVRTITTFGDFSVRSIAPDGAGNVYVAGFFQGAIGFPASEPLVESAGYYDIFISKWSESGRLLWVKTIGGSDTDQLMELVTDADGNSYFTGTFRGDVDFDPGLGELILTSGNTEATFVVKLSSSGELVWAKQIVGENSTRGRLIQVDDLSNVYTLGTFSGVVDFDPGPGQFLLDSGERGRRFLQKLDSSGGFLWATQLPSGTNILDMDSRNEHIYLVGDGKILPASTDGSQRRMASLQYSVHLSRWTSAGEMEWEKLFTGNQYGAALSVDLDAEGDIYIGGNFRGTYDFDPGDGEFVLESPGVESAFLTALNSDGEFLWAHKLLGTGYRNRWPVIRADGLGHIYIGGSFSGSLDFDPGDGEHLIHSESLDGFLLKLRTQEPGPLFLPSIISD